MTGIFSHIAVRYTERHLDLTVRKFKDRGSIDGTIHRFMLAARKGCG